MIKDFYDNIKGKVAEVVVDVIRYNFSYLEYRKSLRELPRDSLDAKFMPLPEGFTDVLDKVVEGEKITKD